MRVNRPIKFLLAATVAVLALNRVAHADLLIKVDKSAQRMTVTLNGEQVYDWAVSTGGGGYNTPSGTFKPFRMEIDHYSEEWNNAPMPYSVFFTKTGDAIHGTYEQRHLGRAVSHGCVRLSVKNAATLWKLVKQEKMANTTVVLTGATGSSGSTASVHRPMSLNAADPSYSEPPQRRYDDNRPPIEVQAPNGDAPSYQTAYPLQDQPRDDNNNNGLLLPFPFIFGPDR